MAAINSVYTQKRATTALLPLLYESLEPLRSKLPLDGKEKRRVLAELSIAELKSLSPLIGEDVRAVLTPEGSVASRNHIGGTAPEAVRAAIARARKRL